MIYECQIVLLSTSNNIGNTDEISGGNNKCSLNWRNDAFLIIRVVVTRTPFTDPRVEMAL